MMQTIEKCLKCGKYLIPIEPSTTAADMRYECRECGIIYSVTSGIASSNYTLIASAYLPSKVAK